MRSRFGLAVAAHMVGLVVLSAAVSSPRVATATPQAAGVVQQGAPQTFERILLTAGRSTVLQTEFDIVRIAITNPAIADATAVQPREVLIDGKGAGTVSLIVWGRDRRVQYDVVVDPGVTALQQTLEQLFPGEDIRVALDNEAIILSGRVSSTAVMLRAAEVAASTTSKSQVVNLLQVPGGGGSQQVMLQVRFAEVNRKALQELGLSWFVTREDVLARGTTQQYAAPDFDNERLEFTDFLNLFFFDRENGWGAAIKALEDKGYFQSLAEPNLIAYNGQEASFLAGGEFPVPVVQGATGYVTITYKEFGVRLKFRPTIAGDVIRLKVRPEVSSLDFNNGIILSGFRVPALTSRWAETDVELRDGQAFAIAGLLNNISQETVAAIPWISKIPIIGNLFKSKADRKERTELMVLITPRLVKPLDPDEVPPLPTMPGRFLSPGEPERPGEGSSPASPVRPGDPDSR